MKDTPTQHVFYDYDEWDASRRQNYPNAKHDSHYSMIEGESVAYWDEGIGYIKKKLQSSISL